MDRPMELLAAARTMTDEEFRAYLQSLSDEEILQALEAFERMGLAKQTGKYRNGKPVYVVTERMWGTG
jgi:hypothetical protein